MVIWTINMQCISLTNRQFGVCRMHKVYEITSIFDSLDYEPVMPKGGYPISCSTTSFEMQSLWGHYL
jgi:hypothetical protein